MTFIFKKPLENQSPLRAAITDAYDRDENSCVKSLLDQLTISSGNQKTIEKIARDLVETVREKDLDKSAIDTLMTQFHLSSDEGIVLMCLAEALLRIPDKETEDLLIKDKLTNANWEKYFGASESTFVNMATRGLAFSGKILSDQDSANIFQKLWYGLLGRMGEPVIREAVRYTMKLLSENFILGRTIDEALKNSEKLAEKGYWFSYDMLGEMARTESQADYYFSEYQNAITALGKSVAGQTGFGVKSISIKLSALHPRYEFSQQETVNKIVAERLRSLAVQAKNAGIQLTVDAEESFRLDISLTIFETVFADPELKNWEGMGLAVQAYQKRAIYVIQWLINLSQQHQKKLSVRLVKGAYWDTEIKLAQVNGYDNYPVFTRKISTDVSYLTCAQLLLEAKDNIYPQFATHNAYTIASILWMAKDKNAEFEFQRLQGMGQPLHDVLLSEQYKVHSRIYAPVGKYQDLLPYLVRRLLENGANSSFVHQIADKEIPVENLIQSPIEKLLKLTELANPKIPLPKNIYPHNRKNSTGIDFSKINLTQQLMSKLEQFEKIIWNATPFHRELNPDMPARAILNPNNNQDIAGYVQNADLNDVNNALINAENAHSQWDLLGADQRALLLEKTADLIESNQAEFMVLLIREAGKNLLDAIAEIREAVDFCRYYAVMARETLTPEKLIGPTGESNILYMHGRGIIACISPWNFPLAIFVGQVAASLVSGNCVIAKPAAQTPLIAAKAISLFYEAGVSKSVLQLLPGSGSVVGQALIESEKVSGVLFTGSTDTAKNIERSLAARIGAIVPFIAETGGMNAMIVDSSALLEQVVMDAMISAFGSAGQRCSALRILFIQNDIADEFTHMLQGAMQTWNVNNSAYLSTDIGPVIDSAAQKMLQAHIDEMHLKAKLIAQMPLFSESNAGSFIAPIAFELPELSVLTKEIFGPVLHIVRFERKNLDQVVDQINNLGFGLTFGIQSRINQTMDAIISKIKTGNIYINRSMTGAVVGVQPFGGCNLSGTGPKAGGPHYLLRLCHETTVTINTTAMGGNTELLAAGD